MNVKLSRVLIYFGSQKLCHGGKNADENFLNNNALYFNSAVWRNNTLKSGNILNNHFIAGRK